jgi:hypothetical protein
MPLIGISSRCYEWADLDEAFSRAVDEWGFDLIEFDTAGLRDEESAGLGLLSQRFGVAIGLLLRLDPAALAPGSAAAALDALRERCEEALASYAVLSLAAPLNREESRRQLSEELMAVLPGYEAAGVRLFLRFSSSGARQDADP